MGMNVPVKLLNIEKFHLTILPTTKKWLRKLGHGITGFSVQLTSLQCQLLDHVRAQAFDLGMVRMEIYVTDDLLLIARPEPTVFPHAGDVQLVVFDRNSYLAGVFGYVSHKSFHVVK